MQIDHQYRLKFTKNTVTLDNVFEVYFRRSLLEDIICDNCCSLKS